MTASARVIPLRPPVVLDPPASLMALLEAVEGLPDATIQRYIDRYFPEHLEVDWGPSWNAAPQSDGYRLHALPCGSLAGRQAAVVGAGELPTDAEMEEAIRRRLWPGYDEPQSVDRAINVAGTGTRPGGEEQR